MELVSVGWGADAIAALASSCSEFGSKMYHLSCDINFALVLVCTDRLDAVFLP